MTKWIIIDGDMDYRVLEHPIEGRMTKQRYKVLSRYSRKKSWREGCGHEWDCCGCIFAERMRLNYVNGNWRLLLTQSLNY